MYRISAALFSFIAALTIALAAPADAQNGRWPGPGGADPSVLRAYGTGTMTPPMREVARAFGHQKGVLVNITSGPVQSWKTQAIRNADIIFTDSEYNMNSLAQRDLPAIIDTATIRTLSLESSSIKVRSGNPKAIRGIQDLGKPGIKVIIGNGPDQDAAWQEVAKRSGGINLIEEISRNSQTAASTAEAQALWATDPSYDAWLVILPGQSEQPKVISRQENSIYRACVVGFTQRSAQKALAQEFVDFIESGPGQQIFLKYSGQPR